MRSLLIVSLFTLSTVAAPAFAQTEAEACKSMPQKLTEASTVKGDTPDVRKALKLRDTAILLCDADNRFEAKQKFAQAAKLLGVEFANAQ